MWKLTSKSRWSQSHAAGERQSQAYIAGELLISSARFSHKTDSFRRRYRENRERTRAWETMFVPGVPGAKRPRSAWRGASQRVKRLSCVPHLRLPAQPRVQLSEQIRITRWTPCFKRVGQLDCDTNSVRQVTQRCSPSCCIYWRRGVRSVAMMFESKPQALSAARTQRLPDIFGEWRSILWHFCARRRCGEALRSKASPRLSPENALASFDRNAQPLIQFIIPCASMQTLNVYSGLWARGCPKWF